MSILSGLLGPAINVATKAAGDYQGAQATQANADQAAVLQRAQLVRQQQQQAVQQALAAKTAERQAKLDRIAAIKAGPGGQLVDLNDPNNPQNVGPAPAPKAPVPGSPEWTAMKIQEAKIGAQYGYHAPRNIDPLSPEGQTAQIRVAEAKPKPASSLQPSEGERKAKSLLRYAEDAASQLDEVEPTLVARGVGKLPLVGNTIQGMMDPQHAAGQQTAARAGRQFAEAWLRYTSGAAISEPELERISSTIIPDPGDTPAQLKAKRQARATILQSLRDAAGRAGDPEDATPAVTPAPAAHLKAKYGLE